jgi:uncharacterized membrane protein
VNRLWRSIATRFGSNQFMFVRNLRYFMSRIEIFFYKALLQMVNDAATYSKSFAVSATHYEGPASPASESNKARA